MATYEDLTEYSYHESDRLMLNVGWLGADSNFRSSGPDPTLVRALLLLADDQQNIMRGVHSCELCDEESPIRIEAPVARGWVSLGMGELHVRASSGAVYAAPSLIVHYVIAHQYQPPAEFRDAVLAGTERQAGG